MMPMDGSLNSQALDEVRNAPMDRDFDIMEMPVSGLAAYWLSLKKIIDEHEDETLLYEESQLTSEPYISHILRLAVSSFSDERVRILARAKKRTLLHALRRKFNLIDVTVRAILANENPRLTIIRMNALFATPLIAEHEAFETATSWIATLRDDETDLPQFAEIDHVHRNKTLFLKLVFCQMYARRMGHDACRSLARFIRFHLLSETLLLIADGFDEEVVMSILYSRTKELLTETALKMDMAFELSLGVRNHFHYEDVYTIALSYMSKT